MKLFQVSKPRGKFGWLPDVPDNRDKRYGALRPMLRTVPERVDLRLYCSPVEDQGELGSCTAQALVGAFEMLERKAGRISNDMSRLFVYYNELVKEGNVGEDAGAMIRTGVKVMAKQGVCRESLWPYDVKKFTKRPWKECYDDGLKHQVLQYQRLEGLAQMIDCLARGNPFVCGISIYESFMSDLVASTGVVNMPGKDEKMLGGHAVMAVGYDKNFDSFIMRNSWGPDWGSKGYFRIPMRYMEDSDLSADFWTILIIE